jgi:hypothetical protein
VAREDKGVVDGLVGEIAGAMPATKGGAMEENKEPTTSDEDVEGHGFVERPVGEQPSMDANTEEPDVEGHGFVEKPVAE